MDEYITTYDEAAEYDAWLAGYADEKYNVACKTCGAADWNTQQHLQMKGWVLTGKGEFCPSH